MPDMLSAQVTAFLLIFARIGAFIMLVPGIGDDSVPARTRLVFALLVTLVVLPAVSMYLPAAPTSDAALLGLMIGELLVGLMMGAIVRILFSALAFAGSIIGLQSGLAAATMFDPAQGQQNPIIARFLALAAIVLIFATGLHHLMLESVVRSYMGFRPGVPLMAGDVAALGTSAMSASFLLGLQMAAPFLVYGIIFNLGLGFIARLTPTIQVFFIAQPLNLILSFALLLATSGLMLTLFVDSFADAIATFG